MNILFIDLSTRRNIKQIPQEVPIWRDLTIQYILSEENNVKERKKGTFLSYAFSLELTQVSDTPSHVYQLAECPQLNMAPGLVWLATEHTRGALSTFPLTTHSSRSDSQVYSIIQHTPSSGGRYVIFFLGTIMTVQ